MRSVISGMILTTLSFGLAFAQNDAVSVCRIIIDEASHDASVQSNQNSFLNTIYDNYCDQAGNSRDSSFNAGLGAVVESIPIQFTLGSVDKSTGMRNFCRNYTGIRQSSASNVAASSNVVREALSTFNQCISLALNGSEITHKITNQRAAEVNLRAANGNRATLQGVTLTGKISCTISGDIQPADQQTQQLVPGYQIKPVTFGGSSQIACVRSPETSPNQSSTMSNSTIYDEATVTVSTNNGPYSFVWPAATIVPQNQAAAIEGEIMRLRSTLDQVRSQLDSIGARASEPLSQDGRCSVLTINRSPDARNRIRQFCAPGWYVAGAIGRHDSDETVDDLICCPSH